MKDTMQKDSLNESPTMRDDSSHVEKFTHTDLMTLRTELLQSSVDSFQAAEIVSNFLSGRGYGVCSQEARKIATNLELHRATPETMQAELERVARVM